MIELALAGALILAAQVETGRVIGTLTCTIEGGLISDASRNMRCSFKTATGASDESYTGSIRKLGSDPAAEARMVAMWEVLYDGTAWEPGFLTGRFVGAATPLASQQLLFKGSAKSIALKPINPPGRDENKGVAPTIVELDLMSVKA